MKHLSTIGLLGLSFLLVGCGAITSDPATAPTEDMTQTDPLSTVDTPEAPATPTAPGTSKPYITMVDNTSGDSVTLSLSNGTTTSTSNLCGEDINTDPVTEYRLYRGEGFSLEIPYNPEWGTADYGYALVDETVDALDGTEYLLFGSPLFIECSWSRSFRLHRTPAQSVEAVRTALAEMGVDPATMEEITTTNGYQALQYTAPYPGSPEAVVILGTTTHYYLSGGTPTMTAPDLLRRFRIQ